MQIENKDLEAVGVILALREGISLESLRRPLALPQQLMMHGQQ